MDKFKDYYKILGVDRNASDEEIKVAYREAAKKYHPDRHPGEEQEKFAELFKQVQEAYDHLGGRKADKKVKREYDAEWDANYAARTSFSRNTYGANGPGFDKQEFSRHTTGTYQGRYTNQAAYEEDEKETGWDKVKQAWQEVREEEKKEPFAERHTKLDRTILNRDKKARKVTTYFDDEYGNRCKGTYIRERKVPAEMLFQFKRGSLHVLYEMLVQLEKIGHVTEDTVPKFVIRNRKTLAGVMAACIIFGGAAAHNETPQQPEAPAYSSSSSVSSEDMAYGEDVIISEEERLEQEKVNQEYTVYRKYEIEFGDTLSGLADLAGCPMSEIQSKNGITNSSMIKAGDEILLPYHIESGDLRYATYSAYFAPGSSLTDFADKYSTTVESIVNLNAEAIEDDQVVSDSLLVPNFASQKEITEQKEISKAKTYSKNQ